MEICFFDLAKNQRIASLLGALRDALTMGLISWLPKFAIPKIWKELQNLGKSICHRFGNVNCDALANFGTKPNGCQNLDWPKFWQPNFGTQTIRLQIAGINVSRCPFLKEAW